MENHNKNNIIYTARPLLLCSSARWGGGDWGGKKNVINDKNISG